jgi:acetyl esterase/lipase
MLNVKRVWPRLCVTMLLVAHFADSAAAQSRPILLWPNGAPGSEGKVSEETVRIGEEGDHIVSNVHHPSITPYLPVKGKATGIGLVIVPGGGHSELWMDHEGYNVAKWFSGHGVAAFVLKYRLARAKGSTYTIEGNELPDVQRALRLVRSRAAEWDLDPDAIGVIGFSAGGELAALAAARYDPGNRETADPVERASSKPAFQALFYPAIPQDMRLSQQTPPAFLACGENDRADIAQGLPQLYLSLKQAGVSAELHIYAGVGHGFGLRAGNRGPVSGWPELLLEWITARDFHPKEKPAADAAK